MSYTYSILKFCNNNNIKTAHSMYAQRMITLFGFIENKDYKKNKLQSTGGRPCIDYLFNGESFSIITERHKLSLNINHYNRKETTFKNRVHEILSSISSFWLLYDDVEYQKYFNINGKSYFADICYPNVKLIIEYDEDFHKHKKNDDKKREDLIKKETGFCFIRVLSTEEGKGIGEILNHFIKRM